MLHAAWFASLLRAWAAVRRAGRRRWMGVFALCAVYWSAALVNATFDVYLEGPVGAVWFWTVFGVGVAAARLHRHHPEVLPDEPVTKTPSTAWGTRRRSGWTVSAA